MTAVVGQRRRQIGLMLSSGTWLLGGLAAFACAADPPVFSDRPYRVVIGDEKAKFVRIIISRTSGNAATIDELEVYGPDGKQNVALERAGAKAAASSCIAGYPQHAVEHLNDGQYGNDFSWVAAGSGVEWAQIELPRPPKIHAVAFSRDRKREYADRTPLDFEILVSTDGRQFKAARKVSAEAGAVTLRPRGQGFAASVPPPTPAPRRDESGRIRFATVEHETTVPDKDEHGLTNLARLPQAQAAASSLLQGYPIHQVRHLNDGLIGNDHSWISAQDPSWAEIDLGDAYWLCHVAFGSDSSRRYGDRAATRFRILTATQYNAHSHASTWTCVYEHKSETPINTRSDFRFKPVRARWVRIAVESTNGSQVRIDEIEVYGRKDSIPLDKIGPRPEEKTPEVELTDESQERLQYAFLGEEHAWLKTYGRADISARLVPYNGRVKEYPRHVGDDALPLPPLSAEPTLDATLDDVCWDEASRGVVRVADPYDFAGGPLVEYAVSAGCKEDCLFLAIRASRLLSGHVATIGRTDGEGLGVLAITEKGLAFNTYQPNGQRDKSVEVHGAVDRSLTCVEARLPLTYFPDCRERGLRIGLGIGGRHTSPAGRSVTFTFSPLSIAEITPCVNHTFRIRLAVPRGGEATTIRGNAPALSEGLTIAPGESKEITVSAERGPIGPQFNLTLQDARGEDYSLRLFRYDPLERTLSLMADMLARLAEKNIDVSREKTELDTLRQRHDAIMASRPDRAAERRTFFDARLAKRRLLLRDPDLSPLEHILFVKRHAYEPSHNYSVILDSPWRPGGGIYRLDIPRRNGRLDVGESRLTRLFDSATGIARDPMANFDLSKIYFAHRPSHEGYFHISVMNPDGTGATQLTDGPFHDFWPCPLPDGGLAMISTRCKARYLCWRPQVFVLFRMDADGRNITPLSYANLSEWAPSLTHDGRILWTRSEYIDKGADFSHTLWTIRPDGRMADLVFGNTIIQPNGYANGREMPGTSEICCTLISHFGDLYGPITLIDTSKGKFNPKAITSITPEVPWPGMWPDEECFRDPWPIARDYVLCSHAPRRQFGLYVIDRFGNREVLHQDLTIGCMTPTPYQPTSPPPVLSPAAPGHQVHQVQDVGDQPMSQFTMADVYQGIEQTVPRGTIKYIRVVEEVRANLERLDNGEYRKDHEPFLNHYAAPVDIVNGPFGWPSYVAKASWGLAPVEEDGSANFTAPAGKTLYFQALDKDLNEVQRMRSVVQMQPGEQRSCIGCHEDRRHAPPRKPGTALRRMPSPLTPPPWGTSAFSYEKVVQPVWNAKCVRCHDADHKKNIDLTGVLDKNRVPASYRTLIRQGWVHFLDCGWNSGGNEKREPYTFGTFQSKLWKVLDAPGGHHDVRLTRDEMHAVKCWIDMNCPLWPDYIDRTLRPMTVAAK